MDTKKKRTVRVGKKKKQHFTEQQIQELLDKIKQQGEILRDLKAKNTEENIRSNRKILEEAFKILALKQLDPERLAAPFDPEWKEKFLPTSIKIRWKMKKDNKTIERHQNTFFNRTSIFGSEIAEAISKYCHRENKFPQLGGFTLIEFIQKVEGKKRYIAVADKDEFLLPLSWPGPLLKTCEIFEFRVTWASPLNRVNSPAHPEYQIGKPRPAMFDAGVNLFDKTFAKELQNVIYRSIGAGVRQLLLISVDIESSKHSIDLAKSHPGTLYAMAGIHPTRANNVEFTPQNLKTLRELITTKHKENDPMTYFSYPIIVAVGECGLDYKKENQENAEESAAGDTGVVPGDDNAPVNKEGKQEETVAFIEEKEKDMQKRWFEEQLKIAAELNLPVLAHEREAFKDFVEILEKYANKIPGIIINCFAGTEEELKKYLQLGCYISITGLLCNPRRGEALAALVAKIPPEKLIVSTDAPYLTPFNMGRPFPKFNESQYLPHVYAKISSVLNIPIDQLVSQVNKNVWSLLRIKTIPLYNGVVASVLAGAEPADSINNNNDNNNNNIAPAGVSADPVKPENLQVHIIDNYNNKDAEKKDGKKEEEVVVNKENKDNNNNNNPVVASDPNTFEYKGVVYHVTEKEKAILEKQKNILSAEQFEKLVHDFELTPKK